MRDGRQDVRVFRERQFRRRLAGLLLDLLFAGIGDAPVGDGSGEDRDIGGQRTLHGIEHLARGFDLDDVYARGIGQIHRAADQYHIGAGRRRGCCNRVALLAG